ncbi:MAG TPA: hypothetical protein VFV29_04655 [Actinomycetota bacterium]|nr:hypothetical protein [Actinomycetota bacterium]
MATSTEPPSVTPNRAQRGANKKRRLPLAWLIVPVVLVAIGVAILLAVRGGGGPIIGGGDEPPPPFDFIVKPATAISTAPDADEAALSASADEVAQEVTPTIDDLYTNAYLDPSNWRHDDYEEVFTAFAPDAAATAEQSVETLTLGATAGDVFDTVDPGKSKLTYQVLFDPDGAPESAVVSVIFRATAERKNGTYLAIVSEGEFFLRQIDGQGEGWTITAFDVTRDDHEKEPPSPSASPSA